MGGVVTSVTRANKLSRWYLIILALPGAAFLLLLLALLGCLFAYSLRTDDGGLSFRAYEEVFREKTYRLVLWNTISISAISATFVALIALVTVPALMKLSPRSQYRILLAVLVPLLLPTLVRTTGWMMVLQDSGLIQWLVPPAKAVVQHLIYNRNGVYIGLTHTFLPLGFLLTWASFRSINTRQVEAAQTMGAHAVRIFFQVILPQIAPGVAAAWIMVFLLSLGAYVTPTLLGGGQETMLYSVIETRLNQFLDLSLACAYGVVITLFVGCIVVIAEKVIRLSSRVRVNS